MLPYRLLLRSVPRRAAYSTAALDKYRAQLERKAKELGAQSVDELQETLKSEIEAKKKQFNKVDPLKELEEYERRQAQEAARDRAQTIKVRLPIDRDTPKLPYKTMGLYIDVAKARELPPRELQYLWRARFHDREGALHASLDTLQFAKMYARAFKTPSFILPLPRPDGGDAGGYEMHFVQWSFVGPHTTHCMLTTVAEYKLHREYAKPHTTLMFHQELSQLHGVVLMNGQVEKEAALTADEATLLVLNVQRFYGGIGDPARDAARAALLQQFGAGLAEFDMEALIAEATAMD